MIASNILTFLLVIAFFFLISPTFRKELKSYFDVFGTMKDGFLYLKDKVKKKDASVVQEYTAIVSALGIDSPEAQAYRKDNSRYINLFQAIDEGLKKPSKASDDTGDDPRFDT